MKTPKPSKLTSKRAKADQKKARLDARLKKGSPAMTKLSASLLLCVSALIFSGCQTADPAARSNRSSYRDIYAEVNGCSNTVKITVGDGLYASADGGGDAMEATATQTVDTKPEVAVGVGGGSAGTGGAAPSSGIAGEALEKLVGIVGGSGEKLTAEEAKAVADCADGNCSAPAAP